MSHFEASPVQTSALVGSLHFRPVVRGWGAAEDALATPLMYEDEEDCLLEQWLLPMRVKYQEMSREIPTEPQQAQLRYPPNDELKQEIGTKEFALEEYRLQYAGLSKHAWENQDSREDLETRNELRLMHPVAALIIYGAIRLLWRRPVALIHSGLR